MLGLKVKWFRTQMVSLETLIPSDNFYRRLEAKLDLGFVRDLVTDCYASTTGRPSIDPVTFFKRHLIMFFEGIRSERQLMETVHLNLAHRWYLGYDLGEPIPDHSSLSKIRTRYGLEVFQRFFEEQIVERCRQAGLVWGKELYFDGTKVRANADVDSLEPRLEIVAQHLETFFPDSASPSIQSNPHHLPRRFVDKYDGTRLTARPGHWYHRTTDQRISQTDPDVTPMKSASNQRPALGYHTHYVVDGGKARIILAALVTPASIMDNTPMLDLERGVCFRWQLFPRIAVGDTKYGTVTNIVSLEQDGIRAYLPTANASRSDHFYPLVRFQYIPERDIFICSQGQELSLQSRCETKQYFRYQAKVNSCNCCPVKYRHLLWCNKLSETQVI